MSLFKEWVKRRSLQEDFDDSDSIDDYEHIQTELFKIVMSKYPDEVMQFLNGIAQRGDQEVMTLLRKIRLEKQPTQMKEPQHPSDGDEVVPSSADAGYGGIT